MTARQQPQPEPGVMPLPMTLYLFTMQGCEFCAKAKTEVVPKLQAEGIFVVTILDFVDTHEICGFKARQYPTWLFASGGEKLAVVEGLVKADKLIALYRKARSQ